LTKIKRAKTLRSLPAGHHAAVLNEIDRPEQSDHGVALVGAAYVDLVLQEAITYRLPNQDSQVLEEMFGDRGALQPFGARIQLGYLLGIYSSAGLKDLRAIKDIRNAFAHSANALAFDNPDIKQVTTGLHYQQKVQYSGKPRPETSRERFVRTIEILSDLMLSDMTSRRSGRGGENLLQLKYQPISARSGS
jgi:hypothetical protein